MLSFKTEPYAHQREAFRRFSASPIFALFMEQRTGKTKVVIDIAATRYDAGDLTALLVVAMPGRVHRNWAVREVPAHLPDSIPRTCLVWEASKVKWDGAKKVFTGSLAKDLDALLSAPGLAILCVNGEAIITEAFRHYVPRFLKARRKVMAAADEFTLIMKTPGIDRTRVMHAIGRRPEVVVKCLLDGTPVGEGPLDLYAPFMFLDWRVFGFTSFTAFKHHFARWKKETNWTTGRDYETLDRGDDGTDDPYLNMDELKSKLAPVSYRVLFRDCFDVPEKVYQTHSFQLTPAQRRVYDSLRDQYEAELSSGVVSARHVLTRYLRLQQVCSNYWPAEVLPLVHEACAGEGCDGCDDLGVVLGRTPLRYVDDKLNPRVRACREVLSINTSAGIIWARFNEDVDQAMAVAAELGRRAVRYDGQVTASEKDAALDDFQAGRADLLVGKATSAGRGVRADAAKFIVYYSNLFSLTTRLQSEDRAEAPGRTEGTGIIDIVAEDTIDDLILLPALRSKKAVADFVLGERGGRWL